MSRNPFTINEDVSSFLSFSSSGLAVKYSVCLINPRVCLLGFIPDRVFFLQCDIQCASLLQPVLLHIYSN